MCIFFFFFLNHPTIYLYCIISHMWVCVDFFGGGCIRRLFLLLLLLLLLLLSLKKKCIVFICLILCMYYVLFIIYPTVIPNEQAADSSSHAGAYLQRARRRRPTRVHCDGEILFRPQSVSGPDDCGPVPQPDAFTRTLDGHRGTLHSNHEGGG